MDERGPFADGAKNHAAADMGVLGIHGMPGWQEAIGVLFYLVVGFGVSFGGLYVFAKYADRIFAFLRATFGLHIAQGIVATAVLVAGVTAHKFKQRSQWFYGIVEVMFGTATAMNISVRLTPGQTLLSQWASLMACAYVVARGLNNYAEAKKRIKANESVTTPVDVA